MLFLMFYRLQICHYWDHKIRTYIPETGILTLMVSVLVMCPRTSENTNGSELSHLINDDQCSNLGN